VSNLPNSGAPYLTMTDRVKLLAYASRPTWRCFLAPQPDTHALPRASPNPFRPARLLPILLALALAASACTSGPSRETGSTSRNGRVAELRSISELRERFNEDSGKVRLILLISPT